MQKKFNSGTCLRAAVLSVAMLAGASASATAASAPLVIEADRAKVVEIPHIDGTVTTITVDEPKTLAPGDEGYVAEPKSSTEPVPVPEYCIKDECYGGGEVDPENPETPAACAGDTCVVGDATAAANDAQNTVAPDNESGPAVNARALEAVDMTDPGYLESYMRGGSSYGCYQQGATVAKGTAYPAISFRMFMDKKWCGYAGGRITSQSTARSWESGACMARYGNEYFATRMHSPGHGISTYRQAWRSSCVAYRRDTTGLISIEFYGSGARYVTTHAG